MANEMQELIVDIAKTQEGLKLGLASFGDVLVKVDDRLSKMNNADEKEAEIRKSEDLKKYKEDFAKEIATMTLDILKQRDGMDVDGATMRSVSHPDVFDSGGGVGDEQENDDVTTDIEDVQRPLQLMMQKMNKELKEMRTLRKHMLKEHASMYEDKDGDGDVDVMDEVMTEDAEEDMSVDMDVHGEDEMSDDEESEWGVEESADYPMDNDEEDFDKMYKSIMKNPKSLKNFIKKQVDSKSKQILKQHGFVEDKGTMPRRSASKPLGISDEGVIAKQSNSKNPLVDIVKSNSNRSWEDLARDYVNHYDVKVPTGVITDEMREMYE